jgi:2-haloalkanoic acid dehalogenase type II
MGYALRVMARIPSGITTLTFDCYGTLIDWEGGLTRTFVEVFGPKALERRTELFAAYVQTEATLESGPYLSYREILREVTLRLGRQFGWSVPTEKADRMAELLPTWTPFADTDEALVRLKKKFRLGILSNIDRDLFAGTARHFSVEFDFIVTAEDVRSYKPSMGHFRRMLEKHGTPGSTLHVAQSQFHDGRPANALGLAFAWINRYNDPVDPSVSALGIYPDLKSLADELTARE